MVKLNKYYNNAKFDVYYIYIVQQNPHIRNFYMFGQPNADHFQDLHCFTLTKNQPGRVLPDDLLLPQGMFGWPLDGQGHVP